MPRIFALRSAFFSLLIATLFAAGCRAATRTPVPLRAGRPAGLIARQADGSLCRRLLLGARNRSSSASKVCWPPQLVTPAARLIPRQSKEVFKMRHADCRYAAGSLSKRRRTSRLNSAELEWGSSTRCSKSTSCPGDGAGTLASRRKSPNNS